MINEEYTKSTYAVKPIAEHLYYWLRQKSGKRFDALRSNFVGNVEDLLYFKDLIDTRGEDLSPIELERECHIYAKKLIAGWNSKYKGSQKLKNLDENGECHLYSDRVIRKSSNKGGIKSKKEEPIPFLPVRFGSHSLSDDETKRIRELAYKKFDSLSWDFKAEEHIFDKEGYARWMIKDFLTLYAKEFEKEFHNACKAETTNPTAKSKTKTKISDIELTSNIHTGDEDWITGLHVHYMASPFDPTTGLFSNPRNYVKIYRDIGVKLEKKYSVKNKKKNMLYKFLDEGTALGSKVKISQDLKNENLKAIQNNPELLDTDEIRKRFIQANKLGFSYDDPKAKKKLDKVFKDDPTGEVKKAFDAILEKETQAAYQEQVDEIGKTIVAAIDKHKFNQAALIEELEQQGINTDFVYEQQSQNGHFKKSVRKEEVFEFTDSKTGLKFSNASFKGEVRKKLRQTFGSESDRKSIEREINKSIDKPKEREPYGLKNIEKVLQHHMNTVKRKMTHEFSLSTLSADEVKAKKVQFFEEYMELCMQDGILVNLNKQGNLTYHKVIKNKKGKADYKAIKYKSSWFADDLQGKTMKELFDLDPETVIRLNLTWIMDLFPQKFMQYNVAYMKNNHNLSERMERSVDAKSYLLVSIQRNYDWKQLEEYSLPSGGFYLYNGQREEPSVYFKPKNGNDDVFDIEFKPFDARKAAGDTWAYIQKEVIEDPNSVHHFYADKSALFGVQKEPEPSDFLRTLYVERAFCASSDVREGTKISNGFDANTEDMMKRKLKYILGKIDKDITKAIDTENKNKFNFNNMHGLCILKNDEFNELANKDLKDEYIDFLVESYVRLEQEGFGEINFEGMSIKGYDNDLAIEISNRVDEVKNKRTKAGVKNRL